MVRYLAMMHFLAIVSSFAKGESKIKNSLKIQIENKKNINL